MAITTSANVEKFIGKTIPAGDSAWVTILISAIETYIKNYTGLQLSIDANASARYFDTKNSDECLIDNAYSITKVEVLDVEGDVYEEIESGDYFTYPLNRPNSEPIYSIKYENASFVEMKRGLKVTGRWGDYSTIPNDLVYVATALVGILYSSGQSKGIESESIGEYSVNFNNILETNEVLKNILDNYKKPELVIG